MTSAPSPHLRAHLVCLTAMLTAVVCSAVCVAAVLAPAPAAVVPLLALVCVGCPMLAAWELPSAIATLRARRASSDAYALATLRRSLDSLPETEHPLGF